ncbi:MAG: cellulase family glycosylhydrolase [Bacteroidales bacterium]|nr:cellulase family glycosylhydrolase [Bacteroidales bacterium]
MRSGFIFLLLAGIALGIKAQEVELEGNGFTRGGNPIWFNGINTPWHHFDDFGGRFDREWWGKEFNRYVDNHINLVRVWIHCSGKFSPDTRDDGFVTGASEEFWEDMDALVEMSSAHRVYIMPALWSFDMASDEQESNDKYRKLIASPENLQSYADNFLIPLVKRYNDEAYLLGWEICNEPEWFFDDPDKGKFTVEQVQYLHGLFASAIHRNSSKPVTTGSASPKWNSPAMEKLGGTAGNIWSDEALQAVYPDTMACLDFYQVHWYSWQTQWSSSPYQMSTQEYQIDDRPVLIGETIGRGHCDEFICQTLPEMYENAWKNGFDGVCAWKTPQNDGHGTFEEIIEATNAFFQQHADLVNP